MPKKDSLPIVLIACQVFQGLLDPLLPEGLAERVTFMDYGLHRAPRKMTWSLQAALDGLESPSLVVFGYGLCGNGLHGLQAGAHTLLIPRADDCIAILLGSRQRYLQEFGTQPGTYYLTKGWLESGSNPLQEYHEYREKYGEEKAAWLMDQQYRNYKRLAFVAHNRDELQAYRPQALEVAEYCRRWGMQYEEMLGSDGYVRRLIEAAAAPERAGDEFVLVPPGGEVTQALFLR